MNKWIVIAIVLGMAVPAMAQFAGLPIGGGAAAPDGMEAGLGAGVVLNSDINTYGGRMGFAPMARLTFFGDIGALDPDYGDMGLAIQGGALYSLPVDLPVDMGLRGSLGWGGYDLEVEGDVTYFDVNGGLLISKAIDIVTPYVFLGLNYVDATVKIGHAETSEDETDFAGTIGLSLEVAEGVSVYGEYSHIDDSFFGFGGRVLF